MLSQSSLCTSAAGTEYKGKQSSQCNFKTSLPTAYSMERAGGSVSPIPDSCKPRASMLEAPCNSPRGSLLTGIGTYAIQTSIGIFADTRTTPTLRAELRTASSLAQVQKLYQKSLVRP